MLIIKKKILTILRNGDSSRRSRTSGKNPPDSSLTVPTKEMLSRKPNLKKKKAENINNEEHAAGITHFLEIRISEFSAKK